MKTCYRCRKNLQEDNFYKDASQSCGLRGLCKTCDSKASRSYRIKNQKSIKSTQKKWQARNRERVRAYCRKTREKHLSSALILGARCRSRKKNLPYDLDEYRDQVKQRVEKMKCELTGIQLERAATKTWNSVSLDRIVPSLGYTYKNIRIVSYAVNCALGTWGEENLRIIARNLLKNKLH